MLLNSSTYVPTSDYTCLVLQMSKHMYVYNGIDFSNAAHFVGVPATPSQISQWGCNYPSQLDDDEHGYNEDT